MILSPAIYIGWVEFEYIRFHLDVNEKERESNKHMKWKNVSKV